MAFGIGTALKSGAGKVESETKRVGKKAQKEILDPLKQKEAGAEATTTVGRETTAAVEQQRQQDIAGKLERRRRPLLTKGRRSTILSDVSPEVFAQSGRRKTLFGA